MDRMETAPAPAPPWAERRQRARDLGARWPHAAEMLRLYAALLDAQEPASRGALADRPAAGELAAYVGARVVPAVVAATIAAGPPALAQAMRAPLGSPAAIAAAWLDEEPQSPVHQYVGRAACGPVLEALGPVAALPRSPSDGGCPRCGGRPQLSYLADSGELLVTAPRRLVCCRCSAAWIHERLSCPGCGETAAAKRPVFSDDERMPGLQADACERCRRYLITVDVRKDPAAVPVVDELVALPLDLCARERGYAKIAPNLMGT